MITGIDHVVLYCTDIQQTINFYTRLLGLRHETFECQYEALHFGGQKINMHDAAAPWSPHARNTAPGSFDICLLTDEPLADLVTHLESEGVAIVDGPCHQVGARGDMTSIYINDPDGNLIEISSYR